MTGLKLGALLFVALAALSQAWADTPVSIVTEEYPPYSMTVQGRLTGFSTEVVQAVLAEIGMQGDFQSMPWARAYEKALHGRNVLIYSIARTVEREGQFKWVGLVAPSEWYLFALKSRGIQLRRLEDANAYQIGTVNGDVGERYLVERGFQVGRNLQSSNRYDINYDKLLRGRVDLWIINQALARYLAKQTGNGAEQALEPVLALPDVGTDGGLYMAFGTDTPDALVSRFQAGLAEVKRKGLFEALKRKWF